MISANFNARRITDPVHGSIGLSKIESEIIDTRVYQRLRNIKQLGLVYQVFPGADYSRFAHSIGVCHLSGLIFESLSRKTGNTIKEDQFQLYRLAALLHDIGHYPFSHLMESAVSDYYSGSIFKEKTVNGEGTTEPEKFYKDHERVGKAVITQDKQVNCILKEGGYNPEDIASIFRGERPDDYAYTNIISSDLDVDRVDYLLRTAHHTGLPYGSVDINYLLSQITQDKDSRICFSPKALRTIDHFLLSRYFDYQQVTYHKTVAATELVLKQILAELLKEGIISCSQKWIDKSIDDGTWFLFDDINILDKIRKLHDETTKDHIKEITRSVLERKPPKLIVESEYIGDRDNIRNFNLQQQIIKEKKVQWAKTFDIDESLWYFWGKKMVLTSVGSNVATSIAHGECVSEDDDKYPSSIRILNPKDNTSLPIMEIDHSLMKVLSDRELYSLRLYILFPRGKEQLRDKIRASIMSELPDIKWK